MINPNICKYVTVDVVEELNKFNQPEVFGYYNGHKLNIVTRSYLTKVKPGRRRLYLKYSMMSDRYYLLHKARHW